MNFKVYMLTKEGKEFTKIFRNVNRYTSFVHFFEMKILNVIECK